MCVDVSHLLLALFYQVSVALFLSMCVDVLIFYLACFYQVSVALFLSMCVDVLIFYLPCFTKCLLHCFSQCVLMFLIFCSYPGTLGSIMQLHYPYTRICTHIIDYSAYKSDHPPIVPVKFYKLGTNLFFFFFFFFLLFFNTSS